jgi:hypothetical protein
MQAITLDVITAGILGIEGRPERGTPEFGLRTAVKWLANVSTWRVAKIGELMNLGHDEPVGLQRAESICSTASPIRSSAPAAPTRTSSRATTSSP